MPHRARKNNKEHYDNKLKWIFKLKEEEIIFLRNSF